MPCGTIRRRINFSATASHPASRPENQQKGLAHPLVGGAASAILARLPAVIEPSIHPHHRQLLHRAAFAGLVGCGRHRAYPLAKEHADPCHRLEDAAHAWCGRAEGKRGKYLTETDQPVALQPAQALIHRGHE